MHKLMHQSFHYINNQARFCILFHSYVSPIFILLSIENTISENDNALSKISWTHYDSFLKQPTRKQSNFGRTTVLSSYTCIHQSSQKSFHEAKPYQTHRYLLGAYSMTMPFQFLGCLVYTQKTWHKLNHHLEFRPLLTKSNTVRAPS